MIFINCGLCLVVLDSGHKRGRESFVDEQETSIECQDDVLKHNGSGTSKVILQSRSGTSELVLQSRTGTSKLVLEDGSDTSRIMDHTYVHNSFLSGDKQLGQIILVSY